MADRRLIYRVILKSLGFLGIVFLMIILFNSLSPFLVENKTNVKNNAVRVGLQGMQVGEIRKTRWGSMQVAVLKRRKTGPQLKETMAQYAPEKPHEFLDSLLRSRKPDYFVYFNTGDSGNCPLFYDSQGFKDTCSGKRFDTTGREKGMGKKGAVIEVPPHYFDMQGGEITALVFGRWLIY